jgi:hypothetical protein
MNESHDHGLKVALMSTEGCLLNVIWMHPDLMVAPS